MNFCAIKEWKSGAAGIWNNSLCLHWILRDIGKIFRKYKYFENTLFLCEDVGAGIISSFGVINGKFLSGRTEENKNILKLNKAAVQLFLNEYLI